MPNANENEVMELEASFKTMISNVNESLERKAKEFKNEYEKPYSLIHEFSTIKIESDNVELSLEEKVNNVLAKYFMLFEEAAKLIDENARLKEHPKINISQFPLGDLHKDNKVFELCQVMWGKVNIEKAFGSILDELIFLNGNDFYNETFCDYRQLTIQLLSLLTDPNVSSKLSDNEQKEIGPFLTKLHYFFTWIIDNTSIQAAMDAYYVTNYGYGLKIDKVMRLLNENKVAS